MHATVGATCFGRTANSRAALAGPNSRYKQPDTRPAGFWAGLWHGLIAVVVFFISLFTPKVRMHETNSRGRLYDFGFLLGVGAQFPLTISIDPYPLP